MVRISVVILLSILIQTVGISQKSGLQFVENKGQWNSDIDFASWFPGGNMGVNSRGFNITLYDAEAILRNHLASHGVISEADGSAYCDDVVQAHTFQVNFLNAKNKDISLTSGKSRAYYNFFLGNDSTKWKGKAFGYNKLKYEGIYDGIDLEISSVNKNLKYDFVVASCADADQVTIEYPGAELVWLKDGDLVIMTSLGQIVEKKPVAYQVINGFEVDVPVNYLLENQKVKFEFPEGYDESEELIIDPLLIFSTFSGSSADSWGSSATPGENGTLYSSGVTNHFFNGAFSGTFPATPGAFQVTYGGLFDISILKYDSLGQNLIYASYLGGAFNDSPHSLIVDKDENLVLLGTTSSSDYPTTFGVISQNYNGGTTILTDVVDFDNGSDMVITKISKDGSSIIESTFLGGNNNDGLNNTLGPLTKNYGDENRGDIITDNSGNIYISSVSWSKNFPVGNSFSTTFKGGQTDAIVAKIAPDLSAVIWAGFLGGTGYDAAHSIKLNQSGNIVVAGGTTSSDFPVTPGSYQSNYLGGADGWIAEISSDGQTILNATYTGSNAFDQVYILDLNSFNEIYVFGQTTGDIPVTPGKYNNPNSGQFVQKFSTDLSSLEWSTVFGTGIGIPNISPTAFLVNDCDNIYLSGWGGVVNSSRFGWDSGTAGLPVSFDAYQKNTSGSDFYFMVLSDEAARFSYGTYLGGGESAVHVDGGTSRFDKRGIVYHAVCSGCGIAASDFPTTPGAYSSTNNSLNCNNAAFKFDLSQLKAQFRTNSIAFDTPNLSAFCFPDAVVFENQSIGGEIFEWRFGDGNLSIQFDTTSVIHKYEKAGSYTVQLKSIDQNTCVGVDSISKVINVYERESFVQPDDDVCYNTSYRLNASGGIGYTWQDSDGNVFSTDPDPEVTLTEDSQFIVSVLEPSGCSYSDTVNLTVVDVIIPGFDLSITNNCFDRPEIELIDQSIFEEGDSLYFDFGDGNTSDLKQVSHSYDADGFYIVKRIAQGELCTFEESLRVPIFTLKVPNVITPGLEDGKNDSLVIQFGDGSETATSIGLEVQITILNRWGKVVFESMNYQNDWKANNIPSGTYYYKVNIPNYTECSGWIKVIK